MTLRALQSSANDADHQTVAPMTWEALNNAGQPYGAPDIDYDRFSARWDSDPIMKTLVDRFDSRGLVIKTQKGTPQVGQKAPGAGANMMDRAAAQATKRAMKA